MAFKAVSGFILFGFCLMAIGGWWMLFDQGIVQDIESKYWISNDHLDVMRMEWHGLPIILFIVGIVILIVSVSSSRKEVVG